MIAETNIQTAQASKYIKWLCGHFNHKAKAEYDDQRGTVQFEFGHCEMQAQPDSLFIRVQADDAEAFERVKYVVGDHLERFAKKESIQVTWLDQ
ncbi:MAG: DUF2218 domain-containing protein [Burkholderiales bacterium]|nr:DUF2218 domain-containing protein [Anaerolineae bacterium]